MKFDEKRTAREFGEKIGYVAGYVLFTTILHMVLSFTNKLPTFWSYLHTAGITIIVVAVGIVCKRLLE